MRGRAARGAVAAAVAAVAVAAAPGAAGGAAAQAADPMEITAVDAEAYPEVTAVVTAPPGLDGVAYPPEAFAVLEDGVRVEHTVERVPTAGLEVILALDTSGSMEGTPLEAAQRAAREFLAGLPPEVRVGIVAFGPAPAVLAGPTTDRAALAAGIDGLTTGGETALYDAVVQATAQFTEEATDRAVVLLSDGGDTASGVNLEQAEAAAAGATVNVIELVTPESFHDALERLAAAGGGTVSSASDPAALADLYRATARALVNRYRIRYTSEAHGPVELTVRLATGDGVQERSAGVDLPEDPEEAAAGGEPAPAAPAAGGGSGPASVGLPAGAAAVFVALLALGLMAVPADPRARLTAARLGATHVVDRAPAVSQVGDRLATAAEGFLERRGRRQTLALALDVAGISLRTGEFVVLAATATVVAALAGLALAGALGVVAALVIVPLAARALVDALASRRRARFGDLLADNLQVLTSSLRSGYGLLQALDTLAREAAEPAATEFRRVLLEVRVGRDPGAALRAVAQRMRSDDFEWVVAAIDINREVGGDLAAVLDNVAATIRERRQLFRQVRALTAEGRISAYVLTALPPGLAAVLAVINPGYIAELTAGAGLVLVIAGAVMLAAGWLWMRRLIRLEY